MAKQIVRQGGQLVETDDANTTELAQLQGIPVTPTTPAGAADVGANPDQAKMAGTGAQKAPVLEDATKPADTLQTAQRTAAPRQQATAPEQQAQEKADRMSALGSLHTRVEAMISNELKLQQPVAAQVNTTATGALPEDKRAQVQDLINRIAANPTDQQVLAEASQFWVENNLGTLNDFAPEKFIATAQETLGKAAADQVRNAVTMETLALDDTEKAALTEALGEGNWEGLTVPQVQAKIEEMRQAEFNRVAALRAELKTATGARREQLVSELADAGQVGATGSESSVRELSRQMASADTVTIGGEERKVEDLLKDENISALVSRMVDDPKLLAEIAKTNPEFAKWVADNKAALDKLSSDVKGAQGQLRDTQTARSKLATVGDVTLSDAVMKAIDPNWGKITASADAPTAGLYSYLANSELDPKKRQAIANALEEVSGDPKALSDLAALDPEEFGQAYDSAQAIDQDDTGLLSKLTGFGPNDNFILDPAKREEMAKFKLVTDAMETAGLDAGTLGPDGKPLLDDPVLLDLIKSGELQSKHVPMLAENPERIQQYKSYNETHTKLTAAIAANDIEAMVDLVFGKDVDLKTLNEQYKLAEKMALLDPTNQDAARKFGNLQVFFDKNYDGKIDEKDAAKIGQMALRDLSPKYNEKKTATFEDIIGSSDEDMRFKTGESVNELGLQNATLDGSKDNFFQLMEKVLTDNKVDANELANMTDDQRTKLLSMDPAYRKKYGIPSADQYAKTQKDEANKQVIKGLYDELFSLGFQYDNFSKTANTPAPKSLDPKLTNASFYTDPSKLNGTALKALWDYAVFGKLDGAQQGALKGKVDQMKALVKTNPDLKNQIENAIHAIETRLFLAKAYDHVSGSWKLYKNAGPGGAITIGRK